MALMIIFIKLLIVCYKKFIYVLRIIRELVMKFVHALVLTVVLMFASLTVMSAQTKFELPKNIELNNDADYKKYEKDIIAAAKWLEEKSIDADTLYAQKVNTFIIRWLSGSPDITISLNENFSKLIAENSQLIIIYMANYGKYYIENAGSASEPNACKAGIKSVLNAYKKGKNIQKSEEIEKLLKLTNESEFDTYIEKFYK